MQAAPTKIQKEKQMKNKKLFTIFGIIAGVIVIAAAAFIGGRLLNRSGNPFSSILPAGGGSMGASSSLTKFNPAPELPITQPELVGTYVKRQDNSIFVQQASIVTGSGSVSVSSSAVGASSSDPSANQGPQQEVVITSKTKIYTDVTQFGSNSDQNAAIQQVVKLTTLDDLNPQGFVSIWGHKDGNRVTADVILYSTPMTISK
jgi:hypothetical protein